MKKRINENFLFGIITIFIVGFFFSYIGFGNPTGNIVVNDSVSEPNEGVSSQSFFENLKDFFFTSSENFELQTLSSSLSEQNIVANAGATISPEGSRTCADIVHPNCVELTSCGDYSSYSNTYFLLTKNISDLMTCLFLGDEDILDLNGYTIKYADANYEMLPNWNFEDWTESILNNWDVSGAPTARQGTKQEMPLIGDYSLYVPDAGSVIVSDLVYLPVGNRHYRGIILYQDGNGGINLEVLNEANQVVCSDNYGADFDGEGMVAFCDFDNQPAGNYKIRVTTNSNNMFLDLGGILPAHDFGVGTIRYYTDAYCEEYNTVTCYGPDYLDQSGTSGASITIKDGYIKSDSFVHAGFGITSFYMSGANLNVENVIINVSGIDSNAIRSSSFGTISYSELYNYQPWITSRQQLIRAGSVIGSQEFHHNIAKGGQGVLNIMGDNARIHDNVIINEQKVTNHYAITMSANGAEIYNNVFDPITGSGILLYKSDSHKVYDNIFHVQAQPCDPEYITGSDLTYSTNAIRINDYYSDEDFNIDVYNNDIYLTGEYYTNPEHPGCIPIATGIFYSSSGPNNHVFNNRFYTEKKNDNDNLQLYALYIGDATTRNDPIDNKLFYNNYFESNDKAVWVTSFYGPSMDIWLENNTFNQVENIYYTPDNPTSAIQIGSGSSDANNLRLINNKFLNGFDSNNYHFTGLSGSYDLHKKNYLFVHVQDDFGNSIANSLVTAETLDFSYSVSNFTDSSGNVLLYLNEYDESGSTNSGGTRNQYGNYNVKANYGGAEYFHSSQINPNVENKIILGFDSEIPVSTCELNSASWSESSVVEGTGIILSVNTSNCEGEIISLELFEDDGILGRDVMNLLGFPSSLIVNGGIATATWITVWDEDGVGTADPEYVFDAIFNGTVVSSEILNVQEETSISFGNPEITSVSNNGILSNDGSFSISGGNFGSSVRAEPVIWEDFDDYGVSDGTHLEDITSIWNSYRPPSLPSQYIPQLDNDPLRQRHPNAEFSYRIPYSTDNPAYYNEQGAYYVEDVFSNNGGDGHIYVDFWMYNDQGYNGDSCDIPYNELYPIDCDENINCSFGGCCGRVYEQFKWFTIGSHDGYNYDNGIFYPSINHAQQWHELGSGGSPRNTWYAANGCTPGESFYFGAAETPVGWNHYQLALDVGTPGQYDAYLYNSVNGVVANNDSGFRFWCAGNPTIKQIQLRNYYKVEGMQGVDCHIDTSYDDVYISSSWARVELCDVSSWEEKETNGAHCEIQMPEIWDGTTIQFTANKGSFTDTENLWLYVIDESGIVSNGKPVSFSSIPQTTFCGDNQIQFPNDEGINEICDGIDFGGLTCEDYEFDLGNLECTNGCQTIDSSGCYNDIIPGDCLINSDCDDSNLCTDNICNAGTCETTFNTNSCNDGISCTENDICSGGGCVAGNLNNNLCSDNENCGIKQCTLTGCQYSDCNYSEGDDAFIHLTLDSNYDDSSGNNNNGNCVNCPSLIDGQIDGAVSFNGVSNFLELGDLDLSLPITLMSWVNINNKSKFSSIIQTDDSNKYSGAWLQVTPDNKIRAGFGDNGGAVSVNKRQAVASANLIVEKEWHHLAATISSRDNIKIYVDGGLVSSSYDGTGESFVTTSDLFTVGRRTVYGINYFDGALDDLRVYTRALDSTEITSIMLGTTDSVICIDSDGDGFNLSSEECGVADCNDENNQVYPGAIELCDGLDNDCNSLTFDGVGESWINTNSTCGTGECSNVGTFICEDGVKKNNCLIFEGTIEICNNSLDDDCDGYFDLNDTDCVDDPDDNPPGDGYTPSGTTGNNPTQIPSNNNVPEENYSSDLSTQSNFSFVNGSVYSAEIEHSGVGFNLNLEDLNESNYFLREGIINYDSFNLSSSAGFVKGKVYFKIPFSWLNANNLNSTDIVLYSLISNVEYKTTEISRDDNFVYFVSEVDSLGEVAIIGKSSIEEKDFNYVIWIIIAVLIIAIIFVLLWVLREKNKFKF